jgi:PAS domain-containing protein
MARRAGADPEAKRIPAGFADVPEAPAPALALLGSDGTILAWGEGCRRLLGHRAEDVVGLPARELLETPGGAVRWSSPPGDTGGHGGRRAANAVVKVRHRDGERFRLTVETIALTGGNGESCWFVAFTEAPDGVRTADAEAALLDRSPLAVAAARHGIVAAATSRSSPITAWARAVWVMPFTEAILTSSGGLPSRSSSSAISPPP